MVSARIIVGHVVDSLARLDAGVVRCIVTSPPYFGLRDYGTAPIAWPEVAYRPIAVPGVPEISIPAMTCSLGQEPTPESFIGHLVLVFREARRVLADDGTLWLNLGDSFAGGGCGSRDPEKWPKQSRNDHMPRHQKARTGLADKQLIGIPHRAAFALQADGWWLRMDNVWSKTCPMPESVKDRPGRAHEYVFQLAKSERYFYDAEAVREPAASERSWNKERKYRKDFGGVDGSRAHQGFAVPWKNDGTGRNLRSVWTITPTPFEGAHFATFPPELARRCVLAGSAPGDTILDPFSGSGTTGAVATGNGRSYVGLELNPDYAEMSRGRIGGLLTTIERAA